MPLGKAAMEGYRIRDLQYRLELESGKQNRQSFILAEQRGVQERNLLTCLHYPNTWFVRTLTKHSVLGAVVISFVYI